MQLYCRNKLHEESQVMEDNINIADNNYLEQNDEFGEPISDIVIPVIEEQLIIKKQLVETETIRISKVIREEEVVSDITLMHEDVAIERVSINRIIDSAPGIRYEGDIMVIPVFKEVTVVEKRLMLIEEVRVSKKKTETSEQLHNFIKIEDIIIENIDKNPKIDNQK